MDSNPKKHSTPSTLFQTRSSPWSRSIAAEVFAFQAGLFPTYQVRMIPMASSSRALRRLGVRGRVFKNAALPFKTQVLTLELLLVRNSWSQKSLKFFRGTHRASCA